MVWMGPKENSSLKLQSFYYGWKFLPTHNCLCNGYRWEHSQFASLFVVLQCEGPPNLQVLVLCITYVMALAGPTSWPPWMKLQNSVPHVGIIGGDGFHMYLFFFSLPVLGFDKVPLWGIVLISVGCAVICAVIVWFVICPRMKKKIERECLMSLPFLSRGFGINRYSVKSDVNVLEVWNWLRHVQFWIVLSHDMKSSAMDYIPMGTGRTHVDLRATPHDLSCKWRLAGSSFEVYWFEMSQRFNHPFGSSNRWNQVQPLRISTDGKEQRSQPYLKTRSRGEAATWQRYRSTD